MQTIHRARTKDRDYLAPPAVGTLVDLDPALLVTPPVGLEVGCGPIATRQEWGGEDPAKKALQ
jgi:hypothetical protein